MDEQFQEVDACIGGTYQPEGTIEPSGSTSSPREEHAPVLGESLIRYSVSDAQIAEMGAEFSGLAARAPENYEPRRKAIGKCRELRVAIEKKRKELKADSLAWGRKVDSVAKHFTEAIEAIENPLQLAKDADDAEKARIKAEKEAAEKAALEAQIRLEREAEEGKRKAERDADEARLRAQRADEEARLAEERAAIELERKLLEEECRIEQQKLDAERAALEVERRIVAEEKAKADRLEFERKAQLKAETEAREKVERERVAAEEARVRELERQAEEARRLEAIRPDVEKVRGFGAAILAISRPEVTSPEARAAVSGAVNVLVGVAEALARFEAARIETTVSQAGGSSP